MNDEQNQKWLCINCNFFLGWIENKNILRVKRKDLYIEITSGKKIVINCCRCGKPNELLDDGRSDIIPLKEN